MGKPRKYPIRSVDKILKEQINIPRRNVSPTRKYSSRMRTSRFCGSGEGRGVGPREVWSRWVYGPRGGTVQVGGVLSRGHCGKALGLL